MPPRQPPGWRRYKWSAGCQPANARTSVKKLRIQTRFGVAKFFEIKGKRRQDATGTAARMAALRFWFSKFFYRKPAFGDKNQADRGPENYPTFSDDCDRHANSGAECQSFGNKLSTGFVNSDYKRDKLKEYCDCTADRFEQKRGLQAWENLANPAQYKPRFKNPKHVISRLTKKNRKKATWMFSVKPVDQIFKKPNLQTSAFQNSCSDLPVI